MLATLAAPSYDLSGFVELDTLPGSPLPEATRRVNRVKTLDGSAVINDGGFSDADTTIVLRWQTTSAAADAAVERMLQLYPLLIVATPAGVFSAAPDTFSPGATESALRLLVLSKLSA